MGKRPPIWALPLGGPDHRLIWWLLCHCDGTGTVDKDWRARAESDLKWARTHLFKTTRKLMRQEIVYRVSEGRAKTYGRQIRLNLKAFEF